jgi:hypothetical protein
MSSTVLIRKVEDMPRTIVVTTGWFEGLKETTRINLAKVCSPGSPVEHLPGKVQLLICKDKLTLTPSGRYRVKLRKRRGRDITLPLNATVL